MLAPVRMSAVACAAAVVALGICARELAQPDRLIEQSFADAFDRQKLSSKSSASVEAARLDPSLLHLSRLPAIASGQALAVGDRITLTARSGAAVAYEVIDVRPLPTGAGGDDIGSALPRLHMITAVGAGQTPGETLRFIVEAEGQPVAVPAAVKPHAL